MKENLTMRSRRLPVSAASLLMVLAFCAGMLKADTRPYILLITCEDNNLDWVDCYGNPHADTANIDGLAAEGFQYIHCYANAPVCEPSRSTSITGMLAISNDTFPDADHF
jgi:N-sulfoglucosamine sulfohydrolase